MAKKAASNKVLVLIKSTWSGFHPEQSRVNHKEYRFFSNMFARFLTKREYDYELNDGTFNRYTFEAVSEKGLEYLGYKEITEEVIKTLKGVYSEKNTTKTDREDREN